MTDGPKGRELWLAGGQELLRRGGVGAVKLQALTDELGLTTGSFYHHFASMADYLDHLARHYGSDQPRIGLAAADDPDPRARLRNLYLLSLDDRMGPLDTAMRDWAGSNKLAARAVHDSDESLLRFIEHAFRDLGYPGRDAQNRAALLYSAGVARIRPPWRTSTKAFEETLEILAPTDPAKPQTMSVGRKGNPRAKRPASSAVRSQSKIT